MLRKMLVLWKMVVATIMMMMIMMMMMMMMMMVVVLVVMMMIATAELMLSRIIYLHSKGTASMLTSSFLWGVATDRFTSTRAACRATSTERRVRGAGGGEMGTRKADLGHFGACGGEAVK